MYIRENVLLATRFFNHRVKGFMSRIVMGGGNPMNVDKYTYKGEFPDLDEVSLYIVCTKTKCGKINKE